MRYLAESTCIAIHICCPFQRQTLQEGRPLMDEFSTAPWLAIALILSLDRDLLEIVGLSLAVSLSAVALAAVIGLPIGAAVAVWRFPGRGAVIATLNALMGLPPVVV